MPRSTLHRAYVTALVAVAAVVGCRAAATPAAGARDASAAAMSVAMMDSTLSLTGWFQTVWGDTPHYMVVDDAGRSTELLLSEEVTRTLGGARALDRKKVKVTGTRSSQPPGALRVSAIQLDTGGK